MEDNHSSSQHQSDICSEHRNSEALLNQYLGLDNSVVELPPVEDECNVSSSVSQQNMIRGTVDLSECQYISIQKEELEETKQSIPNNDQTQMEVVHSPFSYNDEQMVLNFLIGTRRYSEQEVMMVKGLSNINPLVLSQQQISGHSHFSQMIEKPTIINGSVAVNGAGGIKIPEFYKAVKQIEQAKQEGSSSQRICSQSKRHNYNAPVQQSVRSLVGSPSVKTLPKPQIQTSRRDSDRIQISKQVHQVANTSTSTQATSYRQLYQKSSHNQSFSSQGKISGPHTSQPHSGLPSARNHYQPSSLIQAATSHRPQSNTKPNKVGTEPKSIALSHQKGKFPAPVGKIDLLSIESDWKESVRFLDQWNINLKSKNAYTKSEMIEVLKQVELRFFELDKVTAYERKKAAEYKEESKLLNEQIEQYKSQYLSVTQTIREIKREFDKHQEIIVKMDECQQELKQTLLNSLICLDFYKDLESYIQEHKYEDQSKEVTMHFDVIEELIQQHGLYTLDFDTDRIQRLIDSIQDFVRNQTLEKKIIEISINDGECNKSDDEEDQEGLRVKVTKLHNNTKGGSMGLIGQSEGRHHSQNRHIGCGCHPQFQMKKNAQEELKQKSAMVAKLREQLEHKIKKILELKTQLRQERDKESKRRKHLQYKDSVVKLEKEYNLQVIRNTKMQLDNKDLKEECENLRVLNGKQREVIKDQENEMVEFRKALKDKEGFQVLENAVIEMSNLLVSKKNEQLNASQKQQLKAIFGNSSILHKLRQRIQHSEDYSARQSQLLAKSSKLNLAFQDIIEDQWCLLKQIYQNFRSVPVEEINHYSLIMCSNLLKDKWSDEAIDQYESEFAAQLVQLKDLRQVISRESVMDNMSRNMTEDKDKIQLFQMAAAGDAKKKPSQSSSSYQLTGTLFTNATPTHKGQMKSFDLNKKHLTNQSSTTVVKQVPKRIESENKMGLTSTNIDMEMEDEFQHLFDDKQLEATDNLRFSDKQPQVSGNGLTLNQRKASCNSQIRSNVKNIFGIAEDDEDQISQINKIPDNISNNQSVTRLGQKVSKKQLREKVRSLRMVNQQLTHTLKSMQERLISQSKINQMQETDLSCIPNQTIIQTYATPDVRKEVTEMMMQSKDYYEMLQMQAEALEALLSGE